MPCLPPHRIFTLPVLSLGHCRENCYRQIDPANIDLFMCKIFLTNILDVVFSKKKESFVFIPDVCMCVIFLCFLIIRIIKDQKEETNYWFVNAFFLRLCAHLKILFFLYSSLAFSFLFFFFDGKNKPFFKKRLSIW